MIISRAIIVVVTFFLFDSVFKPPFFISRNIFSTAINNNIKSPWKISKI
jgi:hypothetical protein